MLNGWRLSAKLRLASPEFKKEMRKRQEPTMKSTRRHTSIGVLAAVALMSACSVSANTLVDRGLPTANLNNPAGTDRSNVAWLFGGYTAADYWVVGDSFQNTSSSTWFIDGIRLWVTTPVATASLWGGTAESGVYGSTAGTISLSPATYSAPDANGFYTYQGYSGSYLDMWQLDFPVSATLAPGETYNFFLDGTGNGSYVIPFVHASNAERSGSPQEGADDLMLGAQVVNGVFLDSTIESWTCLGNGWDKASDVNVQVFGSVPDGGLTAMLLGLGLVGLGGVRRMLK